MIFIFWFFVWLLGGLVSLAIRAEAFQHWEPQTRRQFLWLAAKIIFWPIHWTVCIVFFAPRAVMRYYFNLPKD